MDDSELASLVDRQDFFQLEKYGCFFDRGGQRPDAHGVYYLQANPMG
jgi:hypothetical protein